VVAAFAASSSVPCRLLVEPGKGSGAARNCGWRAAQGEIIACIDHDCYPDPGYLEAVLRCFDEDERLGFVGGRVLLHDPTDYPITIQERAERLDLAPGAFVASGLILGANFAFRRAALVAVDGFDEWFGAGALFACEDVDVIARIAAAGWAGAYDPRPLVYHHHRRKTDEQVRRLRRQYHRGRGAYYMKALLDRRMRAAYGWAWLDNIRRQPLRMSLREIAAGGEYLLRRAAAGLQRTPIEQSGGRV
jgi:GT2 family glycosyltransferase